MGTGLLLESGGKSATTDEHGIAELRAIAADEPGRSKIEVSAPEFPQASPIHFYIDAVLPSVSVCKSWSDDVAPLAGRPCVGWLQIALTAPCGEPVVPVDAKFTATEGVIIGPAAELEKENVPAIMLVVMPGSNGGSVQVSFPEFPGLTVPAISVPGVKRVDRGEISGVLDTYFSETFEGESLLSSGAGQIAVAGGIYAQPFSADGSPILARVARRVAAAGFREEILRTYEIRHGPTSCLCG